MNAIDVTDEENRLTALGVLSKELESYGVTKAPRGYTVPTEEAAQRLRELLATKLSEHAAAQANAPRATEQQVHTIMRLLGSHEGGGYMSGPTTLVGVRALTRDRASLYIDSLRGEY